VPTIVEALTALRVKSVTITVRAWFWPAQLSKTTTGADHRPAGRAEDG
jgi:hypothetical protein